MNGCLRCVALGVEDHVAFFYARLRLEPWDEFSRKRHAENLRNHMRDPERQTGRTVHGLLEAFAACTKQRVSTLAIREPVLRHAAMDLAKRIGLDIEMVATARGRANGITYVDHHHG